MKTVLISNTYLFAYHRKKKGHDLWEDREHFPEEYETEIEKLIIRKSLEKKTLKEEWTMQGKNKTKQHANSLCSQ